MDYTEEQNIAEALERMAAYLHEESVKAKNKKEVWSRLAGMYSEEAKKFRSKWLSRTGTAVN